MNFFKVLMAIFPFVYLTSQQQQQQQQFYGDSSLNVYLEQFCKNPTETDLILFDNQSEINKKSSVLNSFLQKIKCKFTLLQMPLNGSQLLKTFHQSRALQLVFDLSSSRFDDDNKTLTVILLNQTAAFYSKCRQCLPPIFAASQTSLQQMLDTLKQQFSTLSTDFSSIIVVDKARTIHFRPVLNGCDQLNNLFVPTSQSDFDKLKVPFSQCNFHAKKLNISVVLVSPMQSCFSFNLFTVFRTPSTATFIKTLKRKTPSF